MDQVEIDKILSHTLQDFRLSRGEKQMMRSIVAQLGGDQHQIDFIRSRAFDLAREELLSSQAKGVVDWLEELVKALQEKPPETRHPSACFSPRDQCVDRIKGLFHVARTSVDICVFTITDDRITDSIISAFKRNVEIRLITDNDKALDIGSDIQRLRNVGVKTATDQSANHMHHKYALFDRQTVLTGSYNWTRSASTHNEENFVVLHDAPIVSAFQENFDHLWKEFA